MQFGEKYKMLTCKNTTAKKAADYFKHDYQVGKSRWFGKGATALGLSGAIDDEQVFSNVVSGRSPNGQQQLSARAVDESNRRAALDCTFSAPKSVSLQALVGGDGRLIAAHQLAVEKTLALMEERYTSTRVMTKNESQTTVWTSNLIAAQFDHIESRELDPHLHTHALIMNLTELREGEWYSRKNDEIYANKKLLGMTYQSFLRAEVQKLGYEVEPRKHGQFEIKGFNPFDLVEFSKRRQQILSAVGASASWAEREKAWDISRKDKKHVPLEELKAKWREEAEALEITFVTANTNVDHYPVVIEQKILDDAIAHASERNVAFKLEELECFILNLGLATEVTQIEVLLKEYPDLIAIPGFARRYTTEAALLREVATRQLMLKGIGKVCAIARWEVVENQLCQTSLNSGQRQAVQLAASTNDQFIAWQGVAGSGKTYALKELKAIAGGSHTIKAFAPSAQAAKVLSEELNVQAETVARLLVSEELQCVEPNQIWIIDEAGLLSAKVAQELLERATKEQARVILVGDTRQLSAIEAGNPFKSLQQAGMKTAYLNESLRQRTPELKLAVDLIALGRTEEGFARLEENSSIQLVTAESKVNAIASEYMATAPELRTKTLVLAGTNAERLAITEAIRTQLKQEGSLGDCANATQLQARNDLTTVQMRYTHNFEIGDIVIPTRNYKRRGLQKSELYEVVSTRQDRLTLKSADGTTFQVDTGFDKAIYRQQFVEIAIGDRLKWTKNDRQLRRRNGQEFIVTGIEARHATIEYMSGHHTEIIDLSDAQHFDHALVSTIYSSQGKTAERVLIAADRTIGQESFYVAVSRASRDLKLYTEDKDNLLYLAQQTKAKENPLSLFLREQIERQQLELDSEKIPTGVIEVEKPLLKIQPLPPIQTKKHSKTIAPVVHPSTIQPVSPSPPVDKNDLGRSHQVGVVAHNRSSKKDCPFLSRTDSTPPIIQLTKPTSAFWTPDTTSVTTLHIDPQHWHELVLGSAIHPDIASRNFQSLQQDQLEQEHEAWAHLMYSDKLERTNTGRLSSGMIRKYAHLDAGGWWCDAGVDPRSFLNLENGAKPEEKIWGCFKPNAPRENLDKPGKKIKYEHPPKVDLGIFLLDVPINIAERIYSKYGVNPTDSDRTTGFWYCVWKHNLPVTITEGAKKAASLLSQGHPTIGLPGIYAGYRSKDEHLEAIKAVLHDELAIFATPGREMKFCFDYETRALTKRNIDIAISRTGGLLEGLSAHVSVVSLPGPDKGVDDFIVTYGGLAYEDLALSALPLRDWRLQNRRQQQLLPPAPPRILSPDERFELALLYVTQLNDEELLSLVKLVVENDRRIMENKVLIKVLKSPEILDRLQNIQQQQKIISCFKVRGL